MITPPPSASVERTQLSWRRTLVSITAVGLLLARLAAIHTTPPVTMVALTAIGLGWAGGVTVVLRRVRRLAHPVGRALPLLVILILAYCVMGTLLLVS